MPDYSRKTWNQLRNITSDNLIAALERDGWERERNKGRRGKKGESTLTYRHPDRPAGSNIVVIHPHPKKTMGESLLKMLLDCIGWTEDDLVRLRLVKRQRSKR